MLLMVSALVASPTSSVDPSCPHPMPTRRSIAQVVVGPVNRASVLSVGCLMYGLLVRSSWFFSSIFFDATAHRKSPERDPSTPSVNVGVLTGLVGMIAVQKIARAASWRAARSAFAGPAPP